MWLSIKEKQQPNQKMGRRSKTFPQRRHTDGQKKRMKRSSTSLIREAQIKTTDVSPQTCQDGHYHHHHKKKKKSTNNKC